MLNVFRGAGAVAHEYHRSRAGIFELIEGPAGDGGDHPGLENGFSAIRKVHRALSIDDVKGLVSVVAMHIVFVARLRVHVNPGMESLRVENHLSLAFFRHLDQIHHFDTHVNLPGRKARPS